MNWYDYKRLRIGIQIPFELLVVYIWSFVSYAAAWNESPDPVRLGPLTSAQVNDFYSVSFDGRPVFTENYRDIHYACFALSSKTEIVVTAQDEIRSYTISPEDLSITATVEGNELSFPMEPSWKLVIGINGREQLFLFADSIDTEAVPQNPNVVNLKDFGVDAGGVRLDTEKIQKAIAAVKKDGILLIPSGVYLTGTLRLKSDMTLYLAAGAMLKGSSNPADYPADGVGRRLIQIADADGVALRGRGIIDGNGAAFRASGEKAHLLTIRNSKDIRIEGIILRGSASWNTHILNCDGITVRNVKLINDVSLSNTDGIDPDSSTNVVIEDCFIYAGDDAFAVKSSGRGGQPTDTADIAIRNNVVLTHKTALKIGTETRARQMSRIRFQNNRVLLCDRGMSIYCSDGADISNVQFIDNRFEDNFPDSKQRMIDFSISNRDGAGQIRNILIRDCAFKKPFPRNSTIEGLRADHQVRDIVFDNLTISGIPCADADQARIDLGQFTQNIQFRIPQ